MKLNNKRGISDVITTVLMILLVIAAIGILWAVVQKFVVQGTSSVSGTAECLTTTLTIASATTNSSALTVRVARSGDYSGNLTEIRFFVDGTTVTMAGTKPSSGETMAFSTSTLPNSWTLASLSGKQATIAAVIGSKTCEASNAVTITAA